MLTMSDSAVRPPAKERGSAEKVCDRRSCGYGASAPSPIICVREHGHGICSAKAKRECSILRHPYGSSLPAGRERPAEEIVFEKDQRKKGEKERQREKGDAL